jgi:hypothetical protein
VCGIFFFLFFIFYIREKKELREALEHETNDLRSVNLSRLHPGQGFHVESRNRVAKYFFNGWVKKRTQNRRKRTKVVCEKYPIMHNNLLNFMGIYMQNLQIK